MKQLITVGVHGEVLLLDNCNPLQAYAQITGIPSDLLRATQCSKEVKEIDPSKTLMISLRLLGGKGGFGCLLRGQGMIVRVDNFDACRDLSGRRIRHINDELRITEWKKKKAEEEEIRAEQQLDKTPYRSVAVSKRTREADVQYKQEVEEARSSVKAALQARKRRKLEQSVENTQEIASTDKLEDISK